MSMTVKCPVSKTMALGAVDAGNMNAELQANAAGMARCRGWAPMPSDWPHKFKNRVKQMPRHSLELCLIQ